MKNMGCYKMLKTQKNISKILKKNLINVGILDVLVPQSYLGIG